MKRKIFLFAISALMCAQIFASGTGDSWKQAGESAANAVESLGNAMSETGKRAGKMINEAANMNYIGTWLYASDKATTTIKLNEDNTMEIIQISSLGTEYWKGTFSGAVALIKFKITEHGRTAGDKSITVEDDKSWLIQYAITDGGKVLNVKCANIPTTEDGHNFSNDTLFVFQAEN